tara:strand:+ start:73 stop:909 length:837 start_codon:yes stop_codon:yes gene_type:complete
MIFSLYLCAKTNSIDIFLPVLILSLNIFVYLAIILMISLELFKKSSASYRINVISWLLGFQLISILFIFRDFNVFSDIFLGIIMGMILIIISIFTFLSSFHVILKESKKWYGNMYLLTIVYWVIFHDAYDSWLDIDQPRIFLFIPIVCFIILKIIHNIETGCYHGQMFLDILSCFFLFLLECMHNKHDTSGFYLGTMVVSFLSMFITTYYKTVLLTVIFPLILPAILLYCICILCIQGKKEGAMIIIKRIESIKKDFIKFEMDYSYGIDEDFSSNNIL